MKNLFIKLLLKLWFKSLRLKLPLNELPSPAILGVWHQDLFAASLAFKHRNLCCLISQSKDGDTLSKILQAPNMTIFRGSSSRGTMNIRMLIRYLHQNPQKSIIHALDGPKGPALKGKKGFDWISQKTNSPKLMIEFKYSKKIRLNSWDKMILPIPFSQVRVDWKIL
jgi:lysophospholipid acyltransferase (LPLAT)-like uncharacterized protein